MTQIETDRIHTLLYSQNKILLTLDLDTSLIKNNQLSAPASMAILFHHFQYPCIYYQRIYKYFENFLQPGIDSTNIRLKIRDVEIPSYRPIGLYAKQGQTIEIVISKQKSQQPFQTIYRNWKQGLCIINPQKGAYYIIKTISKGDQIKYFQSYVAGQYYNIPNQKAFISLRGFYKGEIVERMAELKKSLFVKDLIFILWPALFHDSSTFKSEYQGKLKFTSHGINLNINMPSQVFFDNFDYNDAYWYISLDISQ